MSVILNKSVLMSTSQGMAEVFLMLVVYKWQKGFSTYTIKLQVSFAKEPYKRDCGVKSPIKETVELSQSMAEVFLMLVVYKWQKVSPHILCLYGGGSCTHFLQLDLTWLNRIGVLFYMYFVSKPMKIFCISSV